MRKYIALVVAMVFAVAGEPGAMARAAQTPAMAPAMAPVITSTAAGLPDIQTSDAQMAHMPCCPQKAPAQKSPCKDLGGCIGLLGCVGGSLLPGEMVHISTIGHGTPMPTATPPLHGVAHPPADPPPIA